jgi:hypothetical protein
MTNQVNVVSVYFFTDANTRTVLCGFPEWLHGFLYLSDYRKIKATIARSQPNASQARDRIVIVHLRIGPLKQRYINYKVCARMQR